MPPVHASSIIISLCAVVCFATVAAQSQVIKHDTSNYYENAIVRTTSRNIQPMTKRRILEPSSVKIEKVGPIHQIHRDLQGPIMDRYEVGENRVFFQTTLISVTYPLNNLVPNDSVAITTYSDDQCTVNIDDNDYLMPEIVWDENVPDPDGTENREVTIQYTVDPSKIQETDVWRQTEDDQFFMSFCLGFNMYTDAISEPGSVYVNGYDTVILLQVDLIGDFGVEVNVQPDDLLSEQADQIYYAEGFLCNDKNERMLPGIPIRQGELVRVCVKPRDDAIADGVYMRRVDSFYFQRKDTVADPIKQQTVREGEAANDLVTLVCERGSLLCYFEALLNADFYFGPGIVEGFGEAWLQFGSGSERRLQIEMDANGLMPRRSLQSDSQLQPNFFAGSSYYSTNVFVVPPEDGFSFNAVAYECDQWNQPFANASEPKLLGDGIRICVKPDELARDNGILINQIESWNFTKDGEPYDQTAILDGAQANMTLLNCPPGSRVCSFRTQFTPEFFVKDGDVLGFGTVVLQYSSVGITAISRRLVSLPSSSANRRRLQGEEGAAYSDTVAGVSDVSVNTTVEYREDAIPEHCLYEHEVTEWWVQQSDEDKYMYIGAVIGTLLGIASLLLCCWCCPCLKERSRDEEVTKKGGIAVNVDLKKDENKNVTSTENKTENESNKFSSMNEHRNIDGSSRTFAITDGSDDRNLEPGKLDVIFGAKRHPGTRQFIRRVKNIVQDDPDEEYGPSMYRRIMRKSEGCNYFVADKRGYYYVPRKSELRDCIGKIVKETRRNLSEHSTGRSSKRKRSSRSLDRSSRSLDRSSRSLDRSSTSLDRSGRTGKTEKGSKKSRKSSRRDSMSRSRASSDSSLSSRTRTTKTTKTSRRSKTSRKSSSSRSLR